jgi:phosphotransferase system enzyme I (PtsP)
MLVTLRQLMQRVGLAPSLSDALAMAVQQVREAVSVDACAVYLKDPAGDDYVLVASDGEAQPDGERNQRLVRLVGARRELIFDLEVKAPTAPGSAQGPSKAPGGSLLGTPLIHYRTVLGVLAVQKPLGQAYAGDEVTFLVSLGAQLAKRVHEDAAVGGIGRLVRGEASGAPYIQGVSVAPGLAMGIAVPAEAHTRLESVPDRAATDPDADSAAFTSAVAAGREALQVASERLAGTVPDAVRALFDVQLMLLGNDSLVADTLTGIRAGNWAPGAWRATISRHAQVFEEMDDPYLRERGADVREIGQHVLLHLLARAGRELAAEGLASARRDAAEAGPCPGGRPTMFAARATSVGSTAPCPR